MCMLPCARRAAPLLLRVPQPTIDTLKQLSHLRGWRLLVAIILVAVVAWVPATAMHYVITCFLPGPEGQNYFKRPIDAIAITIVISPIIETLMMAVMFKYFSKFIKSPMKLTIFCSVIWGGMHINSSSWGIPAVWGFFILGICYLELLQRSNRTAFYTTSIIHSVFNGFSYILYLTTEHH